MFRQSESIEIPSQCADPFTSLSESFADKLQEPGMKLRGPSLAGLPWAAQPMPGSTTQQYRSVLAIVAAMLTACAHPAGSFRLVTRTPGTLLIPPQVKGASVDRTSLRLQPGGTKAACLASASGLRIVGRSLVVNRDLLTASAPGELDNWAAALERAGCIGPGETLALKTAVIDSLPLEPSERMRLRGYALATAGSADLTSVNSLRVVSPVFRPGAQPGSSAIAAGQPSVSDGQNGAINVDLIANPDLRGYEIAWYDVKDREDGPGFYIGPRSAELHIAGKVEREEAPSANRFVFEPGARWFRFFVKTRLSANDYNIVLLSASTASDLETRTANFQKDAPQFLQSASKTFYVAIPKEIEVSPYIRVKVNGVETDVPMGSSIRQAIEQTAGRGTAPNALARLSVLKPYRVQKLPRAGLSPVEWDHRTQDILNLTLEGGEQIAW
jgi:hypothetical protein